MKSIPSFGNTNFMRCEVRCVTYSNPIFSMCKHGNSHYLLKHKNSPPPPISFFLKLFTSSLLKPILTTHYHNLPPNFCFQAKDNMVTIKTFFIHILNYKKAYPVFGSINIIILPTRILCKLFGVCSLCPHNTLLKSSK